MILEPEVLFAYRDKFIEAMDKDDVDTALDIAPNLSSGRIAQILSECDNDVVIPFLEQVDEKHAADILIKLPREMAAEVFHLMDPEISIKLIDQVPVDDAADIIGLLDKDEGSELLDRINPDLKAIISDLMHYEQGTVGSVMHTYYIAVREGSTVGETLKAMKDAPTQIQNRAYVYVVDKKGRPQGAVSMKDLIRTDPEKPISDIASTDIVVIHANDSAIEASQLLRNRRYQMLPVTNDEDVIIGVLLLDDAIDILSENLAEQFVRVGAASIDESFYTPPLSSVKKRLPWMAGNIFLNLGAVAVIASYEATIEAVAALAIFLPMITDMGGNVGIQALSVSIRSLALGEVRITEYLKAAKKEIIVGLINGLALGALFTVIAIIFQGNPALGMIAGLALGCNVLLAGIVGGTLPFIIKRFGGDPAMMTGPVLTTITDITGVSIYLGLSTLFLASLIGAA
ncbi:MAG: magnesium transporter [Balneolaceae bacterium]|nr:MAG: magnesium transporter [Balneolaceae bacterium]